MVKAARVKGTKRAKARKYNKANARLFNGSRQWHTEYIEANKARFTLPIADRGMVKCEVACIQSMLKNGTVPYLTKDTLVDTLHLLSYVVMYFTFHYIRAAICENADNKGLEDGILGTKYGCAISDEELQAVLCKLGNTPLAYYGVDLCKQTGVLVTVGGVGMTYSKDAAAQLALSKAELDMMYQLLSAIYKQIPKSQLVETMKILMSV